MKFRVERDALADAVSWAARSLATRPTVPVLAGLLLSVERRHPDGLGFRPRGVDPDHRRRQRRQHRVRRWSRVGCWPTSPSALPPHPVEVALDGARLTITCGSARFTLPTMPVEDYPRLPDMPTTAGTVDSGAFATAVAQVAVAAGRDDTLPMLTGVRLEIDGDKLTLAATDRYRLAVRELDLDAGDRRRRADVQVLVPARTLADAAKSLGHGDELTISLSVAGGTGEGIIGFSAGGPRRRRPGCSTPSSRPTARCCPRSGRPRPRCRCRRFARRSSGSRWWPTAARRSGWSSPTAASALSAGGEDEGRAEEELEVDFEGEPFTTAFNPASCSTAWARCEAATARLLFTPPTSRS